MLCAASYDELQPTSPHTQYACVHAVHTQVTFWDKFATGGDGSGGPSPGDQLELAVKQGMRPVLALKGMRVGDFNGKNLGSCGSSTVLIDPDRPEAQQLRQW